jgi:hypothetical protein
MPTTKSGEGQQWLKACEIMKVHPCKFKTPRMPQKSLYSKRLLN